MDNCKEINSVEEHIKEYLELYEENHELLSAAESDRSEPRSCGMEIFAQRLKRYLRVNFSEIPAKWYICQRNSTDFIVFFPQNQDEFDSPSGTTIDRKHDEPCATFTPDHGSLNDYKYFVKIYNSKDLFGGIAQVADFQIDKINFREKLDEIMLRLARERFFLPGEL